MAEPQEEFEDDEEYEDVSQDDDEYEDDDEGETGECTGDPAKPKIAWAFPSNCNRAFTHAGR